MSARRVRVLVAEDDEAVRSVLADLIAAEPALQLVAAVPDAPSAVEAAADVRPEVALVDVRMPGGGGVAAARGILRTSPDTRVLALSAEEDRSTVLQMLEAGVVGYLVKGSPDTDVAESILQAAEGRSSLSAEVAGEVIHEVVEHLGRRRRDEERLARVERRIRRVLQDCATHTIVFQPIHALAGGVAGVEALSRFRLAPQRGPDRWFEEASSVGLRTKLELAAVRRALDALPRISEQQFLSINISPHTVVRAPFRRLLSGVDGRRVVLEITEHAPIADYDKLNEGLAWLRGRGVRIAIDDAGAGFASLRHILRLAPDFIKLDRTLIDGIEGDRSRQALAAGLITFAEKIEATIVAEGIEREAEIQTLGELGVHYGQGYFLARPGPLR